MKKAYINPIIEVVFVDEDCSLLDGSITPDPTGDYDLGDKTINPDDPRDDEGIVGGSGDALSKKNGTFFNSEW